MNRITAGNRIIAILIAVTVMITAAAIPVSVHADSIRKSKTKCTIIIRNANSNTVIRKGRLLRLRCSVEASNKKKVKAKLKFKTSNRKIATVSKKGVIRARKNGTVKIKVYAYVKGRKCGSKTIKVRVGTQVGAVKVRGQKYIRVGKTGKLTAHVGPKTAVNKAVIWSSSNPRAVKVSKRGTIKGCGNGKAVITAKAADGSGKVSRITVYSHKYTRKDTKWIAHRGLHDKVVENTAAAFRLAGKSGFWGCECDIWETKHVDGTFDIVINHDDTFKRVYGVNSKVSNMTAKDIRSNKKLSKVCFFGEYLNICKQYKMIPVIEIKDYDMSDEGIAKVVSMVNGKGLLETAQFISFSAGVLERMQKHIVDNYGVMPYTEYLIGITCKDKPAAVRRAKTKNFAGVYISYKALNSALSKQCNNYGLTLGTWTYRNNSKSEELLYKHIVAGKYGIDAATTDVKYY